MTVRYLSSIKEKTMKPRTLIAAASLACPILAQAQSLYIKRPSEFLYEVREVGAGLEAEYHIPVASLVGKGVDVIEMSTESFGLAPGDVDAVPDRFVEVLKRFKNGNLPRATPP